MMMLKEPLHCLLYLLLAPFVCLCCCVVLQRQRGALTYKLHMAADTSTRG
jgi:hypothetical protein